MRDQVHEFFDDFDASYLQSNNVWGIGFTVIATVLPHEDQEHLLSKQIKVSCTDVTSEDSVLELKEAVSATTNGRLDVLINNA